MNADLEVGREREGSTKPHGPSWIIDHNCEFYQKDHTLFANGFRAVPYSHTQLKECNELFFFHN